MEPNVITRLLADDRRRVINIDTCFSLFRRYYPAAALDGALLYGLKIEVRCHKRSKIVRSHRQIIAIMIDVTTRPELRCEYPEMVLLLMAG